MAENLTRLPAMFTCPCCSKLVFIKDIYYEAFTNPDIKPKGPFCPECHRELTVTISDNDDVTITTTVSG